MGILNGFTKSIGQPSILAPTGSSSGLPSRPVVQKEAAFFERVILVYSKAREQRFFKAYSCPTCAAVRCRGPLYQS